MLNIERSETPGRNISVMDETGNRRDILHVSCSMRPESGFYFSIDVLDAGSVAVNMDDLRAELTAFAADAFTRAAAMGLPTPAVGGGVNA